MVAVGEIGLGDPGADGAAGAHLPRPGIHLCFPDVPLLAAPPDALAAAHGHLVGAERAIALRVPLGGDLGFQRRQIVEPRQDLAARAVGAAGGKLDPPAHRGPPRMPLLALPPDGPVAVRRHLFGAQAVVFRRVPLGGQGGKGRGEVIHPRQDQPPGAHGAPRPTAGPAGHAGLPLVPRLAAPPGLPVGAGGHLVRLKGPVFRRVPLGGDVREAGGKVVHAGLEPPGAAVGAAPPGGPGLHRGLPAVALFALPPVFVSRAVGHVLGRGGQVGRVPLLQKLLLVVQEAEFI